MVDPDVVELEIGGLEEQQLVATTDPTGAVIGYLSGNNAVATVSASGLVEAVGAGNTTITVTASKAGYAAPAPVIIPVSVDAGELGLMVVPGLVELKLGTSAGLKAIDPAVQQLISTTDPLGGSVNYLSGNNAVATVSASGLVTAIGVGNTTITVTASKAGFNNALPVLVPVTVTKDSILMGDVSGDGVLNVGDVVVAVNIVLGKVTPTPAQLAAADLNGDGVVNVQDIIKIVNLLLGR